MNEKKSRRVIYTTENNLENARTSRDTRKTPLVNYVIGNNNNNKGNLRESPENARKPGHVGMIVTSERYVNYKSIYKIRQKKGLF